MTRSEQIKSAYRLAGRNASFYDGMMASTQEKAGVLGLTNISFRQGDVGALPFKDESFDIVLSLNGFHAFPDKEAAYRETYHVLKPGGTFCGCFC